MGCMGRPTFAGWQKVGGPYHPLPPPLREWVAPSAPELRQPAKGRKLRKVQYNATGAKWAMCIYFVPQSMSPLPRSFLAAEPMDPRERWITGERSERSRLLGCLSLPG